jgi:hypothetical protein
MKSSTLPQYTSNPSLIDKNKKQQLHVDESNTSTYSFPHKTNKLQHAKSHGELYQPTTALPFSPTIKPNNDENEIKYREKYSSDSPQSINSSRTRTAAATIVNSPNISQSSPSHKIPLWKRFKKMIVPSKRSKERQHSSSKNPTLLLDELTENEPSKNFLHMVFNSKRRRDREDHIEGRG